MIVFSVLAVLYWRYVPETKRQKGHRDVVCRDMRHLVPPVAQPGGTYVAVGSVAGSDGYISDVLGGGESMKTYKR
jgi:hypothetical protein